MLFNLKVESNMQGPRRSSILPFCANPIDIFGSTVEFNIKGETTYKTFFGCFWTICMILVMLAAYIYYLIFFLDKSNVTMTSQFLQSSTYPLMNFKAQGLFLVLMFKNGEQFYKKETVEDRFYIEANLIGYESTENSSGERTYTSDKPTVTKIVFKPCKSAGITGKVQGKTIKGKTSIALSDYGYCPDIFDNSNRFLMQGDDDSDYYAYIEIKIFPCDGSFPLISTDPSPTGSGPSGPEGSIKVGSAVGKKCLLPNSNGGTVQITEKEKQYLRQQMRDLQIVVGLVDTTVEATNYDDPLVYQLNSNYKFSPTVTQEKQAAFFFQTIIVNTDKGAISEMIETKESYTIDKVIFECKDRDPNDRVKFVSPEGETYQPIPYLTLKFLSGNSRQEYTRKYIKIVDILGLAGGVGQVFTTVIMILYAWYNGIRMEQDIINSCILHLDPDDETVEDWEKARKLSFRDVFRFHYLSCCYKNTDRYKFFKHLQDRATDVTDVNKIIGCLSSLYFLRDSLLSQAQRRLIRHSLKLEDAEPETEEMVDTQLLTGSAAISLISNGHASSVLGDRVNSYLLKACSRHPFQMNAALLPKGFYASGRAPSGVQFEQEPLLSQQPGLQAPPRFSEDLEIREEARPEDLALDIGDELPAPIIVKSLRKE